VVAFLQQYQKAIVAMIVAVVIPLVAHFGLNLPADDLSAALTSIFGGIVALLTVYQVANHPKA
jgi:uncharacterized membrane protein